MEDISEVIGRIVEKVRGETRHRDSLEAASLAGSSIQNASVEKTHPDARGLKSSAGVQLGPKPVREETGRLSDWLPTPNDQGELSERASSISAAIERSEGQFGAVTIRVAGEQPLDQLGVGTRHNDGMLADDRANLDRLRGRIADRVNGFDQRAEFRINKALAKSTNLDLQGAVRPIRFVVRPHPFDKIPSRDYAAIRQRYQDATLLTCEPRDFAIVPQFPAIHIQDQSTTSGKSPGRSHASIYAGHPDLTAACPPTLSAPWSVHKPDCLAIPTSSAKQNERVLNVSRRFVLAA